MKKYKYKSKMFYLHDNDINYLQDHSKKYFDDNFQCNYEFQKNDFINLTIVTNGTTVILKFKYNPIYFIKCYEFNGIYETNEYKGSKNIIKKFFEFLDSCCESVTCRDPLYCHNCGELIGYYFNHDGNFRENVTPLITSNSQCKDDIYDGYEIRVCEDCKNYFCNDCINSIDFFDEYFYLCDSCYLELDDRTDEEKLIDEQNFIMRYSSLEFDDCEGGCQVCNHYDECSYDANECRDGELAFEDMVLSGGYDSIDDFWECNGI